MALSPGLELESGMLPPWEEGCDKAGAHPAPTARPKPRMSHFHGSIDDLKDIVLQLGVDGDWEEKPNQCWKFKASNRAGLNWSKTKGTVWFDGPTAAKQELEAIICDGLTASTPKPRSQVSEKAIFVVHGHDSQAREQLELVLHKLGLTPFVLQETGGGGQTIIEALEKMIGKGPASSFGIVLLTPDDMGYAKRDGETEVKPRARQNVILEMGMLLASLTRSRVAILQKGFVEHPSDINGILYIPFNEHVKETVPKLAQRLQEAGILLDASAIARASS